MVWQPCPMQEGSRKAIIAAFFANLGIAIIKFIGFLITVVRRSAGRGRPLARRHRQPSAADARRQAGQARANRADISSVSATSATSGRSSSPSSCSAWVACSPCTRASRSCSIRTRPATSSSPSPSCSRAMVLETFSLRTAISEVESHQAQGTCRTGGSSARRRRLSSRSCLLEDIGAEIGLLSRPHRRRADRRHRRPAMGRARVGRDRRAARS